MFEINDDPLLTPNLTPDFFNLNQEALQGGGSNNLHQQVMQGGDSDTQSGTSPKRQKVIENDSREEDSKAKSAEAA